MPIPHSIQEMEDDSDSRVLVGFSEEVAVELDLVGQEGFGQALYHRGDWRSQ